MTLTNVSDSGHLVTLTEECNTVGHSRGQLGEVNGNVALLA
jgi:hypothetical protein